MSTPGQAVLRNNDPQLQPLVTGVLYRQSNPNFNEDFAGPPPESYEYLPPAKKNTDASVASEAALTKLQPKTIFLGLATLITFLLLAIPTWNAFALLDDTLYSFMVHSSIVPWMCACCILLFIISYFTVMIFLNRSKPQARTEQSLLMIAGIFLASLGIMLLLFGGPLGREATFASDEFFKDCRYGDRTSKLFLASDELRMLRMMPHCITQDSVEDCAGFGSYPDGKEVKVLKFMESHFMCSGLCQGVDTKGQRISPPTLFNRANYTLSCDGMAARHLKNYAHGIAQQTKTQGVMFVVTAIVINFGQLFNACMKDPSKREELAQGKDYGAI